MSDVTDYEAEILTKASKPASVSNDGVTVTQRSLSEQIAFAKYLRDTESANDTSGNFPLRVFQVVPSGGPR